MNIKEWFLNAADNNPINTKICSDVDLLLLSIYEKCNPTEQDLLIAFSFFKEVYELIHHKIPLFDQKINDIDLKKVKICCSTLDKLNLLEHLQINKALPKINNVLLETILNEYKQ